MKKIGLLLSSLNYGGAERVVSRLTYILSEKYTIYLILFEDTYIQYDYLGELVSLNVRATNDSFSKFLLLIRRIIRLRKVKKNLNLDCVISFLESPNVVNILSRTKECKTAVSIRNYSKIENKHSLISKITNLCIKLLYNKADIVIPVSKVIAESLVKDYGIKRDKLKVIYNPYDIEQIQQLSMEELEPQYKEFIHKEATFISIGRQVYQKGFWHLIKAFKLVHDKRNETKLVLIGRDYQNGKCQKLIDDLHLNESVLLIDQHRNPFKFLKASTVYVLTSLFEGFPNSMVEAMACGCPVIAADCKSGPREILYKNPEIGAVCKGIEKADYGVLVNPLDPQEDWDCSTLHETEIVLADAMLNLIDDVELRRIYSLKAFQRAKDYNYEICKKEYSDIIDV